MSVQPATRPQGAGAWLAQLFPRHLGARATILGGFLLLGWLLLGGTASAQASDHAEDGLLNSAGTAANNVISAEDGRALEKNPAASPVESSASDSSATGDGATDQPEHLMTGELDNLPDPRGQETVESPDEAVDEGTRTARNASHLVRSSEAEVTEPLEEAGFTPPVGGVAERAVGAAGQSLAPPQARSKEPAHSPGSRAVTAGSRPTETTESAAQTATVEGVDSLVHLTDQHDGAWAHRDAALPTTPPAAPLPEQGAPSAAANNSSATGSVLQPVAQPPQAVGIGMSARRIRSFNADRAGVHRIVDDRSFSPD